MFDLIEESCSSYMVDNPINYDYLLNKFGPEILYTIGKRFVEIAEKDVKMALEDVEKNNVLPSALCY